MTNEQQNLRTLHHLCLHLSDYCACGGGVEMRLIDADALKTKAIKCETFKLTDTPVFFKAVGTKEIDNAPTVDAVEVVRCKDCKHSTSDIMSEDYRACWERNTVMPNDGFCSYGERKEATE